MVMAVGGRIRLMRAPDILLFMQMAGDIATCVYHTGLDPFTGEEVSIAKHLRDRKLQRALLQFFKPENYFRVREALLKAGRGDLIGNGCDCLIPAQPPKVALGARMENANKCLGEGKYVHQIPNPESSQGYRPGRKTARRHDKKRKRTGGGSGPRP